MIRATTGGVLRSYRSNLMNSFIRDNKARETVLSQRVFNSYAEDPASAARAFRLRKSRLMASSQLKICNDVYGKYQAAYASLQTVSELIDTSNGASDVSTLKDTTLRMLNDPTGDARTQLNRVLDNLSDTIIQMMNQTYGDEFIFAGADGYNVPFTVKEEDGVKRLYYRDVPVDAYVPDVWKDENNEFYTVNEDGNYVDDGTGEYYLKKDSVTRMTKEAYEEFYKEPPEVDRVSNDPDDPDYNNILEYDRDGNLKVNDDDEGGYYVIQGGDPTNPEDLIPIYKYNDMRDRFDNKPQIVKNADGSEFTVKDENNDDCYLVYNDGLEKGIISQTDYKKAETDMEKLDYLATKEKRFVDIGLGFQEDERTGKLIESSAFNECLSGLTFLGYGMDKDGDPNNIFSIVQRLREIADSASDENWSSISEEFNRMVGKLEDAADRFKTQFTNQSAGTEKLKKCYNMLEEDVYSLKEQYSNLEDVDMADAISSFIWAEYCYNAALKVGNSILSQSLMDYLN